VSFDHILFPSCKYAFKAAQLTAQLLFVAAQLVAQPAGCILLQARLANLLAGLHPGGWRKTAARKAGKSLQNATGVDCVAVSPENTCHSCPHKPAESTKAKVLPKITICNLLKILCTPISEEIENGCTISCTAFGCCTAKSTSPDCSAPAKKEALSNYPEYHYVAI